MLWQVREGGISGDGVWTRSSDGRLSVCYSKNVSCKSAGGNGSEVWTPPVGTGMIEIQRNSIEYCIIANYDDDRPKTLMIGGNKGGSSCSVSGQSCLNVAEKGVDLPLDRGSDTIGFICSPSL